MLLLIIVLVLLFGGGAATLAIPNGEQVAVLESLEASF